MDPGGISVGRTLAIDGALIGEVLLRLRRDAAGAPVRWTLGDRGIAEIDANFITTRHAWTGTARVWDVGNLALATIDLRITVSADDAVHVELTPTAPVPSWWETRVPQLLDVTHAALDELSEELLWHAMRAGVSATS